MQHFLLIPLLLLQFAGVDRLFTEAKYVECEKALQEMLPQAEPGHESSEVLWRLSRAVLLQGDEASTVKAKREFYTRGIEYAEKAIEEDPKNPEAYMWHSGNIGRDCLTRSLTEQAKASGKVQKDLTIILNRLGKSKHSSAWHALAELYWRHPFKSTDAAVNFARRAVATIPSGEVRLITCNLLADILLDRGWGADKRAKEAAGNAEKFQSAKTNIDKYGFYDGSAPQLPWVKGSLGEMTDREEALAVLRYAQSRYNAYPETHAFEQAEYKNLLNRIDNLK